jgi:hypothetical protein
MCRAAARFVTSSLSQQSDQDPAALARLHGAGRLDREASISLAATNRLAKTSQPTHPPKPIMQYHPRVARTIRVDNAV